MDDPRKKLFPRHRDDRHTTAPQPGSPAHRAITSGVPREFAERDEQDLTGRYEGEELAEKRAEREPDERIGRLEVKHDKLESVVTTTRIDIGHIKGTVETIKDLATRAEEERTARHKREAEQRDSFWKRLPAVIKAVGIAIAMIVTAALGYAAHGGH